MKRKTATVGLLGMLIVIALATVGLVVGNWGQKLSINGNVQTGSVAAEIQSKITSDNDVKDTTSCVSSTDPTGQKVTVTIENAYPGYDCHFWTNIINRGSLPIAVQGVPLGTSHPGLQLIRAADDPSLPKGDCRNNQLMPGAVEYCDWDVLVTKEVPQNAQLSFAISVCTGLVMPDGTIKCTIGEN